MKGKIEVSLEQAQLLRVLLVFELNEGGFSDKERDTLDDIVAQLDEVIYDNYLD